MPAYVIADIDVSDPTKYEEYKKLAPATIAQYGGKYLARGGKVETLEGSWSPSRLVIVEFESAAQATEWYDSPEYRAARAKRQAAAKMNMIVVEGL